MQNGWGEISKIAGMVLPVKSSGAFLSGSAAGSAGDGAGAPVRHAAAHQ